jgi:hypothetical protein
MIFLRPAPLLACIICLSPAVWAQDDRELEMELFFAPAETVTSAARHEQEIGMSPSAITVLTREDIETSGIGLGPQRRAGPDGVGGTWNRDVRPGFHRCRRGSRA